MKRLALAAAAALLGVLVAGAFLLARDEPHDWAGTVYSDVAPAADFELTADDGTRGGIADFRGKVVLIYFGYTFCPDICPASLAELAQAMETIDPSMRDDVQVMMISVDPERDTPEAMHTYLEHFDPTFVGFTGTDAEIAEVAADYNVFYQVADGSDATGYLVDHWSGVYLVDREGNLVESFGFDTAGEDIAADVLEWL